MAYITKKYFKLLFAASLLSPSLAIAHPTTELFSDTAFIQTPEVVNCTLENGVETQCHQITVGYLPEGQEIGPFCPATLDDKGGLWDWTGENAGVYRIDKAFFLMLDELGYRFFDDDGNVYSVDNADSPPEVDHACINVAADESVKVIMLLPTTPVMADEPSTLGTVAKVGVALDGIPIFADAPSIQERGHLPALDVCGGHIDPGGWYHWHATSTDIKTALDAGNVDADCSVTQDKGAMFGYAFDGFAMFGSSDADGTIPTDLDQCSGHVGIVEHEDEAVYHYHSTEAFPNLPKCLVGVSANNNFVTTASNGIGAERGANGRPGGMPPGFEEAAVTLGVSSEKLMEAISEAGGRDLDFVAASAALGVTEEQLRAALPQPPKQ